MRRAPARHARRGGSRLDAATSVLVVFDTRLGHTAQLAFQVAHGVKMVEGCEPVTRRVASSERESIVPAGAEYERAMAQFEPIEVCSPEDLRAADAIVTGCPTRFGQMTHGLKALWDRTGGLWQTGALQGKVGAAFCSTSTPHGGQEMTIMSQLLPMMHHGMVIVAPGYGDPSYLRAASPYGATNVSGQDADGKISEDEERAAQYLGRRVAEVARRLSRVRSFH